ncbi:hypothetical protein CSKR_203594 [Clonorchis sinensis]|uniref:Uncharacterized protein n=1 Tax=Clonorchis sinensis TaxID=79923 RepID=A0A8T1MBJ2_CLOSI|nr:hypothetical protein CSKR_203594 [Clonorchis sinensis]
MKLIVLTAVLFLLLGEATLNTRGHTEDLLTGGEKDKAQEEVEEEEEEKEEERERGKKKKKMKKMRRRLNTATPLIMEQGAESSLVQPTGSLLQAFGLLFSVWQTTKRNWMEDGKHAMKRTFPFHFTIHSINYAAC